MNIYQCVCKCILYIYVHFWHAHTFNSVSLYWKILKKTHFYEKITVNSTSVKNKMITSLLKHTQYFYLNWDALLLKKMQLFFSRYFLDEEGQSSYMNSTFYMKHSLSHVLKSTMDGAFFKITMTSANPSVLPDLVYLVLPLECTTIFITSLEIPGTVVQI